MPSNSPTALVIVFDNIEEVEALTPVDILRRAGVEVTIASVNGQPQVTGRNQITFAADTALSLLEDQAFDLIFLPGGPGVLDLLENQEIATLLKNQAASTRLLAAICAAPKVLAVNGILDGKSATSHSSVRNDLPLPSDLPVVADGNIVTSQGVGTAIDFSLKLVRTLCGEDSANEIAASIHHNPSA